MVGTRSGRTYSIKEVAALVGLPASTLRYYEDVNVIPAIARDPSSGHRIYREDDLELLTWVSCLSASGMSIADMREYVRSGIGGERDISEFITLLEQQDERLREKRRFLSCVVSSCGRRSRTGVRSSVGMSRKLSVWMLRHVLSLSV